MTDTTAATWARESAALDRILALSRTNPDAYVEFATRVLIRDLDLAERVLTVMEQQHSKGATR